MDSNALQENQGQLSMSLWNNRYREQNQQT